MECTLKRIVQLVHFRPLAGINCNENPLDMLRYYPLFSSPYGDKLQDVPLLLSYC